MKKNVLLQLTALLFVSVISFTKTNAQTITYTDWGSCVSTGDSIDVYITGYITGETLKTYFGDGTSATYTPSYTSGSTAQFYFSHPYASSGSYTLEFVLISATGTDIDSLTYLNNFMFCDAIDIIIYDDLVGTCAYDTADRLIYFDPGTIEIDSAGVPIDTTTTTNYTYYNTTAPIGTVYTFKALSNPFGFIPCGADSVNDTLGYSANPGLYLGFTCDPSVTAFDNAVFGGGISAGLNGGGSWVYVTTTHCAASPLTLTLTFSPKYSISSIYALYGTTMTYTISGNSATVNFTGVSSTFPVGLFASLNPVGTLTLGDTINSTFYVTPIIGDINPSNNTVNSIDTIRASYDPNNKSVEPDGNITAGTTLQYMISFENTGNDTAHNIEIMDTLSDNLNVNTIKQIASSAEVEMTLFTYSGHNVVQFSFPNINLLDSTYHGECTGFAAFTINTKSALSIGTKIDNKGGIYFDDNSVVMTNNVENIIGTPTNVPKVNNQPSLLIYPNPTSYELNITGVQQNTSYRLLNIMGECMQQGDLIPGNNTLSIQNFTPGIYILEMTGQDGVKDMVRVVKE